MAKQLNVSLTVDADVKKAKAAFEDLQKTLSKIQGTALTSSGNLFNVQEIKAASQAAKELQHHLAAATDANTGRLNLSTFSNSLKTSGKTLASFKTQLESIGPSGEQAFVKVAKSIAMADNPLRRTNGLLTQFKTTLVNTARWQISSSILHGFMGAVQQAYGYAQDLNESLNNIRIVTGYNVDKMAEFATEANKAAKALSTTTTAYTNASLIYYQQGLDDKAVKARTDVTIKLANVSRQSAEDVSNQLTAVWNNFAEGSEDLEHYVDVMAKLGATTASSTQEISTGLEKFAAVASTVGLSFDYATSALATITATTRQSADVVGTALKTLFARIQDLELGNTLDDGTTLGKYSKALEAVGVNIKDMNGEIKNMDTILDELGAKWNTISKDQQIALAQTVAGTRQYAQLIALMDNWDFMKKNLNTAANAEGELQRQADVYAESWEAASKRVRASLETIYTELLDDKFFVKVTNAVADLATGLNGFIQGLGGMKGVLLTISSFIMQSLAKEAPVALNRIIEQVTQLTGQAQKAGVEMQSDVEKWAQAEQQKAMSEFREGGSAEYLAQVTAIELLAQKKREYNQNEALYNSEQKQRAQDVISELENTSNMIEQQAKHYDELKVKAENSTRSVEQLAKVKLDSENLTKFTDKMIDLQAVAQQKGTFKKLKEEFKGLDLEAAAGNGKLQDYKETLLEIATQTQKAGYSSQEFVNKIAGVSVTGSNAQNNLQSLTDELEKQLGRALSDTTNKTTSLQTALEQILQLKPGGLKELIQNLQHTGEAGAGLPFLFQNIRKNMDELPPATTKTITQLMSLSSAIMQVNAVISSITRLKDVFSDEDSTTIEKIGAVVGVLTGIMFAYNAVAKLTSVILRAENKSLMQGVATLLAKIGAKKAETKADIENTAAKLGQKAANDAVNASMAQTLLMMGLVLVAVLAITAAIWLLAAAFKAVQAASPEGKLKAAKEATEAAANAAEEAKTAYEDLKDTIEGYEDAVASIEELTKGTDEFREAVEKANDAARELIKTYGITDFTVDQNGVIQIGSGDLESRREYYRNRASQTEWASTGAQNYQRGKENDIAAMQELFRLRGLSSMTKYSNYGGTTQTNELLTAENIAKVQKAIGSASFVGQTSTSIADAMEWTGQLDEAQQDFINVLLKAGDSVADFGTTIQDNTKANEAATKSQLAANLANEKAFLEAKDQSAVLAAQMNKKSQTDADVNKIISGMSKDDLYKKYAEAMGYSSYGTGGWLDGKERFFDEKGNKVADLTDETIRAQYAEILAQQTMTDNALKETISAVNTLLTSAGNNANIISSVIQGTGPGNITFGQSKLTSADFAISDEEAKAIGYDKESYAKAIQEVLDQSSEGFAKLGLDELGLKTIDQLTLESGTKLKDIVNDMNLGPLGEEAGQKFIKGLNTMLASVDEDKQTEALDQLMNIDWSDWDAGEKAKDIINSLGGEIEFTDKEWQKFIADMRTANFAFPDFTKLKADLQSIAGILDGLDFGKAIKDDDYQKLIKFKEGWSSFFIAQADGTHKFIGDQQNMKQAVMDSLTAQKEALDKRSAAVKGVKDTKFTYGDTDQVVDWGNVRESSAGAEGIQNLWGTESGKALLEELGYTEERIKSFSDEAPEEVALAYQKIAEAMNADYDVESETWNEARASLETTVDGLLSIKDSISETAFDKQLSYLIQSGLQAATTLEDLYNVMADAAQTETTVPLQTYADALLNIASQYQNTSTEAAKYKQLVEDLRTGQNSVTEEMVQAAEAELRLATYTGELAKKHGLSEVQLERYADELGLLKENANKSKKALVEMAKDQMRFDKAVISAQKNMSKWEKDLAVAAKTGHLVASTADEMAEAYGDLLDIDGSELSAGFLQDTKNLDLMKKALKGNEEAYNDLMQAVQHDIEVRVNMDDDIIGKFDAIEARIANLPEGVDIGAELHDEGFLAELENLVNAAGMTAQQATDYLSSMGIDAEVVNEPQTVTETVGYNMIPSITDRKGNWSGPGGEGAYSYPVVRYSPIPVRASRQIDGTGLKVTSASKSSGGNVKHKGSTAANGGSNAGGGGGGGAKHSAEASNPTEHRYSRVENAVEGISNQYDILAKARERAWGADKLSIMDSEIAKLKQLKNAYGDYLKEIAGADWEKLFKKIQAGGALELSDITDGYLAKDYDLLVNGSGDIFYTRKDAAGKEYRTSFQTGDLEHITGVKAQLGSNGKLANKDEILAGLDAYKFNMDTWWNDEANQENEDDIARKTRIDLLIQHFEDAIDQYDETVDKFYEQTNNFQDALYQIQDLNFEKWQTELDIEVDLNESQLKRLEIAARVLGDSIYKTVEVMKNLFSADNKIDSQYSTFLNKGQNYEDAYNKAKELYDAGEISQDQFIQAVQTARDGIYEVIDSLLDMNEKMRQFYSQTIDGAVEELRKLTDQMAHHVEIMEHLKNLLSLTGKQFDYASMETILKGTVEMKKNALDESTAEYKMFQKQVDEAKAKYQELVNNPAVSEDAAREFKEAVLDPAIAQAREAENKMYEDAESYLESVVELYQNTLDKIMAAREDALTKGLGWDFLADSMSRAKAVQDEYLTKTNQIYETNTLMRKLAQDIDKTDNVAAKTKLKNFSDEIAQMQKQEKLNQSDLDIAKARYELLLAQIALEEAQNAKSIVRLQRDSEGNYGYVYTADQEKINDAEQNFADKQNDLYNLVLGQANDYGEKITQIEREKYEALQQLALDYQEGRITTQAEFDEKYLQTAAYYDDLLEAQRHSYYTALGWLDEVATTDHREAWTTAYKDVIDAGSDYRQDTIDTFTEIKETMDQLDADRQVVTDNTSLGLQDLKKKTDELRLANQQLKTELITNTIPTMGNLLTSVADVTKEWALQYDQIMAMIQAYMRLAAAMDMAERDAATQYDFSNVSDFSQEMANEYAANGFSGRYNALARVRNSKGTAGYLSNNELSQLFQTAQQKGIDLSGQYFTRELYDEIVGMASGGYTGEWGSDGKLAILHEKELVLGAEDTANMLATIELVRQISSAIDLRAGASSIASGLNSPSFGGLDQTLEQEVTIHAEFPNATDHAEIEEAFNNLINRATQYAARPSNITYKTPRI